MIRLILILLLAMPVYASTGIGGHIEIGKDIYSNVTYTDLRLDYDFTFWNFHLIPYGEQITWFYQDYDNIIKGYPFRDVYIIGTELKYMSVTFGVEHYCSHAVSSGQSLYRKPNEPPLAYNMTKVFARYEF